MEFFSLLSRPKVLYFGSLTTGGFWKSLRLNFIRQICVYKLDTPELIEESAGRMEVVLFDIGAWIIGRVKGCASNNFRFLL